MYGLKELREDTRDLKLGAYKTLPNLSDLPKSYRLPFFVKNQGDTDWCTAFATCSVSEVQEEVYLEPAYTFAATKYLSGGANEWGADLREACKAHQKLGALDINDVPPEFKTIPDEQKRLWFGVWSTVQDKAYKHRKASYFRITGQYDHFDNIRASLFLYQTPIAIGIQFGYPLQQTLLGKISEGFGHAMTVIGFDEQHLIVGNSYGTSTGDNGVHYITREVINHWIGKYGAFTFLDISPEEARKSMNHGILWKIEMFLSTLLKGHTI
jgi:hypothetical protein